jgi:hypothetical protein
MLFAARADDPDLALIGKDTERRVDTGRAEIDVACGGRRRKLMRSAELHDLRLKSVRREIAERLGDKNRRAAGGSNGANRYSVQGKRRRCERKNRCRKEKASKNGLHPIAAPF